MTFALEVYGIRFDGQYAEAEWQHRMGGGELRYDEQSVQAGPKPGSKAKFEWDGYTARTLELDITLVNQAGGGRASLSPEEALALLHQAHRGGDDPNQHTVAGRLARAMKFDHPWVIRRLAADESSRNGSIGVTVLMVELDPDAVTAGASPITPGSGDPDIPPDPDQDAGVSDDTRNLITDAEGHEVDYGWLPGDDGGE